tara:strand:- start:8695 stop:8871 length:177 start_codon:yes stop_codon:yes gene_type:complete
MAENNPTNREKLAQDVVESWDFKTLLECAQVYLQQEYESDQELFDSDWESFYYYEEDD